MDVNDNGTPDQGEPFGCAINNTITPDPIIVAGADVNGVDMTYYKTYNILGQVYYDGEETGPIYVLAFDEPPHEGSIPVGWATIPSPGGYVIQVPNGTYYISAMMDVNENGSYDEGEPAGFAINKTMGESPDPIVVNGADVPDQDITLGFPVNNPPNTPTTPTPSDGATDVDSNTSLTFYGGDPDTGDQVYYHIYFGTNSSSWDVHITTAWYPSDVTGPFTHPPGMTLTNGTTYYWQIIAEDNQSAQTPGPVWSFTTACEPFSTVTYPYYEPIDGDEPLTITGTAVDECNCIEIENVSLALYYTDYSDPQTPTYYWNDSAGEWQWTTILYNPVEYVSGGCPDHQINWSFSPDTTFYRPGAVTYYIHVAPQPEDQNTGVVTSEFYVGIPDSDFVAYWELNGDLTDSIGSNHGSTSIGGVNPDSGVTPTTGLVGQGYAFDGSIDYIYLTNPVINGRSDWTWSGWIKPNSSFAGETIYSEGTPWIEFAIYVYSNGNMYVSMFDGTWLQVSTSGNEITLDEWNHITITLSGGGTVKIYVGGEEVANGTGQVISTSYGLIGYNTGRINNVQWPHGSSFWGDMDEIAVFNKALSSEEARQCYQNAMAGLNYLGY
jgi:hypothetical protein